MSSIKINLTVIFIFFFSISYCQNISLPLKKDTKRDYWVDSVFNTLSNKEKIAQLIIIRSFSDQNQAYYDTIAKQINNYNIGGICFFKGNPVSQALVTNYYQKTAKTPLFISIDGEWGLNMRLENTPVLPRQMTLGALDNDSLIYSYGKEVAYQCKRLGIHINFAPVADINSNPKNPVINSRSFGEDKYKVARKSIMYMKGMQENGILTSAKHFPGHGDTDNDSHYTLPIINHSKETILNTDLFPFKELINNGITGVMVAHLFVPALDSTFNTASSLSKDIISNMLKNEMKFDGLIYTDALEMKGVTNYYKPGIIELKALQAGNDILLLPENINIAIKTIQSAIDSNLISQSEIDLKCKKVLTYKYLVGLNNYKPIDTANITTDLNNKNSDILINHVFRNSLILLKNENQILPLKELKKYNIASLSFGTTNITDFQTTIESFCKTTNYTINKEISQKEKDSLLNCLKEHNLLIIGIHNTSSLISKNYGISKQNIELIESLSKTHNIILCFFAYPFSMNAFSNELNAKSIIIANQDKTEAQKFAAQLIFGASPSNGILPITVSEQYPLNLQNKIKESRLGTAIPEEFGIDNIKLIKIDSIALNGIKEKAYPGCQILLAKDGKIFYDKSFGTYSYTDSTLINKESIYDLASVTKVAATTLAVMKLYEQGKLNPDKKLSSYLKYLKSSNKKNITIREVMAHQAGLKSWIPFYKVTLRDGKPDETIYQKDSNKTFSVKVAENLFIRKDYKDIIIQSIIDSELNEKKTYEYSDLGFYLLKELIEKISKKTLNQFLNEHFYNPLGLKYTCFNPLNEHNKAEIVPTENDQIFRNQLIQGYVHDPGAAMMGGVSGHAGLFSNAADLAVIFQMLLQNGEYGGVQFLKPNTIKEFTKQQYPENNNRRGLGFDRQLNLPSESGPTCKSASKNSYGHSGFTGTYFWVDPDYNLIYIFLSNRVNPDASNSKLSKLNIRTEILQLIYNELRKK